LRATSFHLRRHRANVERRPARGVDLSEDKRKGADSSYRRPTPVSQTLAKGSRSATQTVLVAS
jgi:hypothetical protein